MSKHTPGPWKAGFRSVTAPETEDDLALNVRIIGGNPKVDRANARLIAAAPDLLAALEETLAAAVLWIDDARGCTPEELMSHEWYVRARAAIAKATGSPS